MHDLHSKRKNHRRPVKGKRGQMARVRAEVLMNEDGLMDLNEEHLIGFVELHKT